MVQISKFSGSIFLFLKSEKKPENSQKSIKTLQNTKNQNEVHTPKIRKPQKAKVWKLKLEKIWKTWISLNICLFGL